MSEDIFNVKEGIEEALKIDVNDTVPEGKMFLLLRAIVVDQQQQIEWLKKRLAAVSKTASSASMATARSERYGRESVDFHDERR